MARSIHLVSDTAEGDCSGVKFTVLGGTSPALITKIVDQSVFFEHHIMAWKDAELGVVVKRLQGTYRRSIHGKPVFMVETTGHGEIAFSRGAPGQIVALTLETGQTLNVREHQWLCATSNLDFSSSHVAGVANMLFSGSGLYIDTFSSASDEGGLWLFGYGNVFEIQLDSGDAIDVDPGCWIYKDPSVQMTAIVQRLSTGAFGDSGQYVVNRFTGPGRLGIQTMYSPNVSND